MASLGRGTGGEVPPTSVAPLSHEGGAIRGGAAGNGHPNRRTRAAEQDVSNRRKRGGRLGDRETGRGGASIVPHLNEEERQQEAVQPLLQNV